MDVATARSWIGALTGTPWSAPSSPPAATDGFVPRDGAPTTPPQVAWRLSGLGAGLTVHPFGLLGWIEPSLPANVGARRA